MDFRRTLKRAALAAALPLALALPAPFAVAQSTLRVVMHSDLKILDPIWTTAYMSRNHGYMVYDTLFAMDAAGKVQPQMVDRWTVSPDGLVYTMTLRDGLLWHDGAPVTAEDCVASIKRWAAKDAMGQKLMTFVKEMQVVDAKTIGINLKAPTGLVLGGLGKPSSAAPFMMPKRVAETDPNTQITDFTGFGPFVFSKDEWQPGDKTVYAQVRPVRAAQRAAVGHGGRQGRQGRPRRVARDRRPADRGQRADRGRDRHDRGAGARPDAAAEEGRQRQARRLEPARQPVHVPLQLDSQKPFDNPKVRQAVWHAFNQEGLPEGGHRQRRTTTRSARRCSSAARRSSRRRAWKDCSSPTSTRPRRLLKEAGYDGTPIVLMHSTDLQVLTNLAPVAKQLLEKAGFKVDMQSMDWQSLVARRAKKDAPDKGGWHAFLTSWVSADVLNPVMTAFLNSSLREGDVRLACDAEIEKLRDAYAKEGDPAKQKAIAEAVQVRWAQNPSHIFLGQWYQPAAMRTRRIDGVVVSGSRPGVLEHRRSDSRTARARARRARARADRGPAGRTDPAGRTR